LDPPANPDLDPERLAGMEAGIDYQHGPISLSLMAHANRLKDAIANVMLGHGPGVFLGVGFVGATGTYSQRQNVRAISVRGIDVSAEWTDGPWSIRAGASIAHARMDAFGAAGFLDGLRPAQTPRFSGSLSASWEKGGKGASIVLRRVGPNSTTM